MSNEKKFILCPRCELNYIEESEGYCKVCKASMGLIDDDILIPDDDEMSDEKLCPVCTTKIRVRRTSTTSITTSTPTTSTKTKMTTKKTRIRTRTTISDPAAKNAIYVNRTTPRRFNACGVFVCKDEIGDKRVKTVA